MSEGISSLESPSLAAALSETRAATSWYNLGQVENRRPGMQRQAAALAEARRRLTAANRMSDNCQT